MAIIESSDKKPPQGILESMQDALIRRFSKVAPQPEPVVFEFTSDRAMLHQYYRLRDQIFGRDVTHSDGSGGADIHDKISEILPMETEEFKLRDIFPNLPLHKERHAAISKFAILEEHRQQDILHGLCKLMFDRVIASDTHYVFSRTTRILARNWRMIANSFGATHTRICDEIDVPPIPNFDEKPYLVMSDLSALCQQEFPRIQIPAARKLELID